MNSTQFKSINWALGFAHWLLNILTFKLHKVYNLTASSLSTSPLVLLIYLPIWNSSVFSSMSSPPSCHSLWPSSSAYLPLLYTQCLTLIVWPGLLFHRKSHGHKIRTLCLCHHMQNDCPLQLTNLPSSFSPSVLLSSPLSPI